MARQQRAGVLPPPYLKRIRLDSAKITDRAAYPFCLPFLRDEFELEFDRPITIIVGEIRVVAKPSDRVSQTAAADG